MFGGQTSLGEVYDVVSGRQVEARMTERQEPVSLAAAGIAPEALPRVQHADGFLRYQVAAAQTQLAWLYCFCRLCCSAVGLCTWKSLTVFTAG